MTEEGQNLKVGVCVPWDSPFVYTLPMFNMLNWERPDNTDVAFFMGAGWCPAARHNDAVQKALNWGADIIMFNGADHLCPFDILKRMLARLEEGWDMVHASPPSRGICGPSGKPFDYLSFKIAGKMPAPMPVVNMPPESTTIVDRDGEPQEVHIAGTGNIMMKAAIFDGLKKPYFTEFLNGDDLYSRLPIQDSHFTFRCTVEGGARMLCDTSLKIVHLDIFGIDETFSSRFQDKTGQEGWSPSKDLRKYVWPIECS